MTRIFVLLIAILVGFLTRSRRGVLAGVILPMLAVTAVQSRYLGTGRGHWVVQLMLLALACGVAFGLYAALARHAARGGHSSESRVPAASHLPFGRMLAAGTLAGFAGTVGPMFATDRPSHPGTGNLPITGVVGIVIALIAVAVFAVLWLRNRPEPCATDAHELAR